MFGASWKSNADEVLAWISNMPAALVRPAMVDALNWTAYDIVEAEKAEMRTVFDDPAPWTLNSMRVEKATMTNPVAGVGWKDSNARTSAGQYLVPQVRGGPRPQTPFEYRLVRIGKLATNEFLVPGRFAERNGRGDLNPGQLTKILSDLGAIDEARKYPGARNRGVRRSETYYMDRKGSGTFFGNVASKAPPGIYLNKGGRQRLLVFAIVKQPMYRPVFDFYGVAERFMAANFAEKYGRALERRLNGPLKRR
ncbi:hypothetical protein [Reyranella sp.]|uniref:hypothetical protein n=1 Tax=Reyranella sp. TaxID=1929291 RepID=UPI003C7D434D